MLHLKAVDMEVVQVAIIVMTVLVFFQAVFISALFLISGKRLVRARARIDAASRKLSAFLENGGVLVGRVEEFCQELPAIEEKVVQILSAVRRTTRKSDELAEKSLSFLRDRLERAETESAVESPTRWQRAEVYGGGIHRQSLVGRDA